MKFTIDNLDDLGPRDYSQFLDAENLPKIVRVLNRPSHMTLAFVAAGNGFRVPATGAKVCLERRDGTRMFTGYLESSPDYEYLGVSERGSVYRYHVKAIGEEYLLDRKATLTRPAFVERNAGEIIRILASDVCPDAFDTAKVQNVAIVPRFRSTPAKKWSEEVAEVALRTRGRYRVHDGEISLERVGGTRHSIDENAEEFSPESLRIERLTRMLNDVTIAGRSEPDAYVKDYFMGDGYQLRFSLSETPFMNRASTIVEEEYEGEVLRPQYWRTTKGAERIAIAGGKLGVNVGMGAAATEILFGEAIELGAASHLQHGDFEFTAASDGVVGGLYAIGGARGSANCVAGFQIQKSGAQSTIRALVNGAVTGDAMTTVAGRKYLLSTRIYANQAYRAQQLFVSSKANHGGAAISSGTKFVLEVHEIDPSNPVTIAEPSKVLYDGVAGTTPGFCDYALVNGTDLHCRIAYTRLRRIANVEVRSVVQGLASKTKLLGPLSEGGECSISSEPALYFYAAYPPMPNEAIVVSYRSIRRSLARLVDAMSVAAQAKLNDDGVRSAVMEVLVPEPRTSEECADAARAFLDDSVSPAWRGEYVAWSSHLNGEVFPGDTVTVNARSRNAEFEAIVRKVEIELRDPGSDLAEVKLSFANDAAEPLACAYQRVSSSGYFDAPPITIDATLMIVADMPSAEIKTISSTFVTVDTGIVASVGGGFEVRRSDAGWGATNDRNLIGRFTTTSFNVPRISRVQDYWIRMYDAANNYSQHSTLLHIDYPL